MKFLLKFAKLFFVNGRMFPTYPSVRRRGGPSVVVTIRIGIILWFCYFGFFGWGY